MCILFEICEKRPFQKCMGQRHCPETICCEVNIPLLGQPHLAPLNGLAVPCFHPGKTRVRGKAALIRGGAKIQPLDFVVPNRRRCRLPEIRVAKPWWG